VNAGPLLFACALWAAGCGGDERAAPAPAPECAQEACLTREVATWPMPNPGTLGLPNPARYEAAGELVEDRVTRLAFPASFGALSTYADAVAFCETLELEGHDDFRLPTRIELVSLLDRTRTPAIDTRVFPDTPQDYFWTSTPLPGTPGFRYSVYFGAGETSSGEESRASAYVRCVRAGARRAPPRYAAGDGFVEDLGTGLSWQAATSSVPLSLTAARSFCQPSGEFAGRLPSEKELETLLTTDVPPGAPLIDDAWFGETPADDFWAAVHDPIPPLIVSFATGFATVTDGAGLHYTRCVR
jgi:hypothetical protein